MSGGDRKWGFNGTQSHTVCRSGRLVNLMKTGKNMFNTLKN